MIEIDVPGRQIYRLEHLVLDLNGTLSLDGNIIDGVPEKLDALRDIIDITIITADTHGRAQELERSLRIKTLKINPGDERNQKLHFVRQLGSDTTVSIGNGSNDAFILRESVLGICVLGPEGTSSEAIANCDLVTTDTITALDMLVKPRRLIATLRK
ncbi:MAG: hypothetical protein JXA46_14195 [Dehalococcoidales bacterium]|nr:hypothetical protein [Dehalococcoidales bacterium]